nr:ribonuclease H-like domain-containing protein [Tanacetum cinerariifolium]
MGSDNPQHALKYKGVINSGCLRHMTGNMSYLSDFEDINGGYVAFGGNPKGGKITGDLTCVFAKATLDKSNLWHKRLGYINFKTMNKLVKGNLVKGLPSKVFENNHTCVACKKGKQHRASCKTKPISSVSQPLRRMKGVKREFSVARTPQQNGIAEKKNRTLIKATRTMLADLLLPISFWAEAVNTACYVQNRVLVTKPHNKTPYELLLSKTPSIGFMRPFHCLVTILNTLDPSGKFNRKADEGFLVGYSVSSIQEHFDAEKAGEENVQQYVLFPLWSYGSKDPQNTDNDTTFEVKEPRFEFEKPESEVHVSPSSNAKTKKHDDKTKIEAKGKNVRPTFGKSSYVDPSQYPDDPNMPALEDITYSNDEEHVGAEADFTNLETNITISPIPTTRVHKDYHDELLQFNMQKFWVLVDFPNGKRAIGLQVKQKADGIFICQDKYIVKILRKFGLTDGKSASTPIDTEKPLLKDPDGKDVDVHTYSTMDSKSVAGLWV